MRGRTRCALSVAVLLALGGGCAGFQQTAATPETPTARVAESPRAVVNSLEFVADGRSTRVHLGATGPVRHRLVASADPSLVEVDLYDVTLEGVQPRTEVGDGIVDSVALQALPGGGGRVAVRLAGPGEARVETGAGGVDLVLSLQAAAPAVTRPVAVQGPAVRLLSGGAGLSFALGGEAANLSSFPLSEGARLVVDVDGVDFPQGPVTEEFATGPVARVQVGRREAGGVRAVLEARQGGTLSTHRLERRPDGFVVLFGEAGATQAGEAPAERPVPVATLALAQAVTSEQGLPGGGRVVDLGFRQEPERSLVEIGVSDAAPYDVVEATGERVVLDLHRTTLPEKFRRALDTSAFSGPISLVAAYERGADTRVVVDLRRPAPYQLLRDGTRMTLAFEGGSDEGRPGQVAQVREGGREIIVVEGDRGGPEAEKQGAGPGIGKANAPLQQQVYTGRRLSMDFVDADIRNVLRIIGEVSGLNVVAGDGVSGKVTVRLVDVPWDQALEVILKTRGLGQVREGNVIRIAPADQLAQEKARAAEAEKAAEEKAPLISDILPVNYASAQEIADRVKDILSDRGAVSVDQRTNAILVKDVAENVEQARELVARLDTQTPQVMIEARIVEVSSTFARDLGIQWGGQFTADTAHGNATDWAFPHSVGVEGSTGTQQFAVNFPAAVAAGGPGGAIAMTLGHVNDVLSLDLRLSAIETSGKGRVLSSPRVATLDNKTAEINQGIEIPFTTATEEKIETQSIEYKLRLNVTPHVTADRSIIMKIDVAKDAPSATFFATDGTPAIETRAATTEVLVKDGETTVIGGIITDTQSESEAAIPVLGKIPYLGALFRQRDRRNDKTELIIFITPKIANVASLARNP